MRLLQIVTLTSDEGAFGGPLTVARHQTEALNALGHETILASTTLGPVTQPVDDTRLLFPAVRLPGLRFGGIWSRQLVAWLGAHLRTFDLVHIHASRDLVSLPAMVEAIRYRVPFVVQTHGMIVTTASPLKQAFDLLLTRRLLLRAVGVIALQDTEVNRLVEFGVPAERISVVPNAIPLPPAQPPHARRDRPVILFCARLHPRKRVASFLEMATLLRQAGVNAEFSVIGPDDGDGHLVRAALRQPELAGYLIYEGGLPHAKVLQRMAQADIFVLPSVDEPYPMTLLEAMSLGVPSVVTTGCHIADHLRGTGAALVVDPEPQELANAVAELVRDQPAQNAQADHGRQFIVRHATPQSMALRLQKTYSSVLTASLDTSPIA